MLGAWISSCKVTSWRLDRNSRDFWVRIHEKFSRIKISVPNTANTNNAKSGAPRLNAANSASGIAPPGSEKQRIIENIVRHVKFHFLRKFSKILTFLGVSRHRPSEKQKKTGALRVHGRATLLRILRNRAKEKVKEKVR